RSCARPFAFHRAHRSAERICGFGYGQATEEAQLHDACHPRVQHRQPPEGLVSSKDVGGGIAARLYILQRNTQSISATLLRTSPACVVHEDVAHGTCGEGVEARAALPRTAVVPIEPDVYLVHERRGGQRLVSALRDQPPVSDRPE